MAGGSDPSPTSPSPTSPPAPEPQIKELDAAAPMDEDEKSIVMRSQSSVRGNSKLLTVDPCCFVLVFFGQQTNHIIPN